jgi:hypothetical protein
MVVIRPLPHPSQNIWYLAYGSNLSSAKFINDRLINLLSTVVVAIPGFKLTMENAGFPYRKPPFANIRPLDGKGSSI